MRGGGIRGGGFFWRAREKMRGRGIRGVDLENI